MAAPPRGTLIRPKDDRKFRTRRKLPESESFASGARARRKRGLCEGRLAPVVEAAQ